MSVACSNVYSLAAKAGKRCLGRSRQILSWSMDEARILVAGAGAIGSVIGGMLHAAGHDVTLLGRTAHVEAIARDGQHITGLLGTHTIRGMNLASDAGRLDRQFDLIL